MIWPGPPCPANDGRHKPRVWHDKAARRSGFACNGCFKTWEYVGDDLHETYALRPPTPPTRGGQNG